jgi:hypothetical protein
MDNLTMVFLGTHFYSFDLPFNDFRAAYSLDSLDRLHEEDEPEFEHAKAICVSKTGSGFVSCEAVQWFLCFPLKKRNGYYVPRTESVPPRGRDVFYSFFSHCFEIAANRPIRAVSDMDSLAALSPRQADKLVVIRVRNWRWGSGGTVLVRRKDIIKTEIIHGSEVRF